MKLIPLTQGKFAKVDDADYEWLNQHKWYAKKTTSQDNEHGRYYAARFTRINGVGMTIYMHRVITDCPEDKEVDHLNHDTLDNQGDNLRVCTRKENMSHNTGMKYKKN